MIGKQSGDEGQSREDVSKKLPEKLPPISAETLPGGRSDPQTPPGEHGSTISARPSFIGEHRIIRLLGVGGMGTVYEAEQAKPKRHIAIKVIKPGLASDTVVQRFDREAEVLGRLQHPGIAQIYEAGAVTTEGVRQPYFAMELVRGQPITQYVRNKKLGLREQLELLVRVCEAVQYAHERGVIHRDLKPSNILVDEQGQPKILDFGLAKIMDAGASRPSLETMAGQILGTLPYMSPEQARGGGETLDTRSDIYALGVVAYEILSGRLPHNLSREMMAEAVRVICEEDPAPLSSADRGLAGDIETIVGKAMSKERERRYTSALDLASDIRHFLADEPITARQPSLWYRFTKYSKRHPSMVLLTLFGAGVFFFIAGVMTKSAVESMGYFDVVEVGVLPGDAISFATAINDNGDVIGTSELGNRKRGFLWTNGQLIDLGGLGGNTVPMSINNSKEIVGRSDDQLGGGHPFVYSSGKIRALAPEFGTVYSINNAGVAVGKVGVSTNKGMPEAGFVMTVTESITESHLLNHERPEEQISTVTAINQAGHYVGLRLSGTSSTRIACLVTGPDPIKGRRDLGTLGGALTWATAINRHDQVVGMSDLPGGRRHAFLYSKDTMFDLGTLPGHSQSLATAINDDNVIVGISGSELMPSSSTRGFRRDASGLTDINTHINPSSGWTIVSAHGINARGQIAATGLTRGGEIRAVLLRPPRWSRTVTPIAAPPPQPPRKTFAYRVIDLGPQDNEGAKAVAINNRGEIVGWCVRDGATHPLLWRMRVPNNPDSWESISLAVPPEAGKDSAMPSSINNRGRIIGSWSSRSPRELRAIVWNSEQPDVVLQTGLRGIVSDINDADRFVGVDGDKAWYCDLPQNPEFTPWPRVEVPELTSVSSIANNGDMSGSWNDAGRITPCLVRNGQRIVIDIPESVMGVVNCLNARGQAVGRFKNQSGIERPFLYSVGNPAEVLEIGALGRASALRINSKGDILMISGSDRAYIRQGDQIIDINESIDPSLGLKKIHAADINDRGEIVGSALVP